MMVRDALDIAEQVHPEGEQATPADFDFDLIDTTSEALDVWRAAQRQKQAAELVWRAAGQRLAELLGDGGAAGIGDGIVRYRRGWTEQCIDPAGLEAWLTQRIAAGEVPLSKVVNVPKVKRAALTPAARETFFEKHQDPDPSLQMVPKDRVPKFLQHLSDGDIHEGSGVR